MEATENQAAGNSSDKLTGGLKIKLSADSLSSASTAAKSSEKEQPWKQIITPRLTRRNDIAHDGHEDIRLQEQKDEHSS